MGRNALAWARKVLTKAVLRRVGPRALSLLPAGALVPLRRDDVVPVAELDELADQGPVVQLPVPFGVTLWLVTGHEAVKKVLADTTSFSNDFAHLGKILELEQNPGGLGFADPPVHTRLRKVLTPEFTMRRLARLAPRIDEIVADCLDSMAEADGPVDLVEKFALPIPSLTICELLGVPYAERSGFQERTAALLDVALPHEELFAESRRMREFMLTMVHRARRDPGDDLISALVGTDLGDDELAGLANLLLIAGHETTANMLALGTYALLRHPDQLAALRADPELIGGAVEELLRWLSIVPSGSVKVATADTSVGGQPVAAGDLLVCSLPLANHDPDVVDRPAELDVSRRDTAHVAFGHGVHHCLGAPLARVEMRVAFARLLDRFPGLRLATDEEPRFRTHSVVYGLEELRVTW